MLILVTAARRAAYLLIRDKGLRSEVAGQYDRRDHFIHWKVIISQRGFRAAWIDIRSVWTIELEYRRRKSVLSSRLRVMHNQHEGFLCTWFYDEHSYLRV